MTTFALGRSAVAVSLGIALLAVILAFVPAPLQILAALVALPLEAFLLATATATQRRRVS